MEPLKCHHLERCPDCKEKYRAALEELRRIRVGMGDDYGDDPVSVVDALKTDCDAAPSRVSELERQLCRAEEAVEWALTDRKIGLMSLVDWRAELRRRAGKEGG